MLASLTASASWHQGREFDLHAHDALLTPALPLLAAPLICSQLFAAINARIAELSAAVEAEVSLTLHCQLEPVGEPQGGGGHALARGLWPRGWAGPCGALGLMPFGGVPDICAARRMPQACARSAPCPWDPRALQTCG